MDQTTIERLLEWAYDKSLEGIPGTLNASELGDRYLRKHKGNIINASHDLINWQSKKCATSGFLTGIGGLKATAINMPINVASVIYIQIRMVSAIALMANYDLDCDEVRSMIYICLTGNTMTEILKDIGVQYAKKGGERASSLMIKRMVVRKLAGRLSNSSVIKAGKWFPVIGGVIGGILDFASTKVVGESAIKLFIKTGGIKLL